MKSKTYQDNMMLSVEKDIRQFPKDYILVASIIDLPDSYFILKNSLNKQTRIAAIQTLYRACARICYIINSKFDHLQKPRHVAPNYWYDLNQIELAITNIIKSIKDWFEGSEFDSLTVDQSVHQIMMYLFDMCRSLDLVPNKVLTEHAKTIYSGELASIKLVRPRYNKKGRPSKQDIKENSALPLGYIWPDKLPYKWGPKRHKKVGRPTKIYAHKVKKSLETYKRKKEQELDK